MKNLNRMKLIEFIKTLTGLPNSTERKNIFTIDGEIKNDQHYQIEFIPATSKYLFTIYVKGIYTKADILHDAIVEYCKGLNLQRNIVIDTETQATII